MQVRFKRTGERRYATFVVREGEPPQGMDPAPAYDDDIPHDLVHYVVEAELGLANGVYGRAAQGAGTFVWIATQDSAPRERARQQRRQRRRERSLAAHDERHTADMSESERLAAVCDLAFRRKRGQRADATRTPPQPLPSDAPKVERVVSRLEAIAPRWRALRVGDELVFEWPSALPAGFVP